MRFRAAAVLSATLLLGSSLAWAEPTPQDIAQARTLGGQAQTAFDAGNFAESEKMWIAAQNLYPAAPTLTLGLARTQAKLGKLVLAQEHYQKIINEQGEQKNLSPAFKDALDSARNEIGAVSARIASVVITVEGPTAPTVTIDGQPVAVAGLGLKRPVDPGSHTVKAEAPGFKGAETKFDVAEAGNAEAKLTLEKAPDAPVAGPVTGNGPSTISTDGKSGNSNKTFALVAFGVGGAGLIFGAVTGLLAMGKHSDLEGQCPDSKCPATTQGDIDSYKTMGTLSTVGFIVAGVGVAAGAVLWLTAPKEAPKTGVNVRPFLGLGSGGVAGTF